MTFRSNGIQYVHNTYIPCTQYNTSWLYMWLCILCTTTKCTKYLCTYTMHIQCNLVEHVYLRWLGYSSRLIPSRYTDCRRKWFSRQPCLSLHQLPGKETVKLWFAVEEPGEQKQKDVPRKRRIQVRKFGFGFTQKRWGFTQKVSKDSPRSEDDQGETGFILRSFGSPGLHPGTGRTSNGPYTRTPTRRIHNQTPEYQVVLITG